MNSHHIVFESTVGDLRVEIGQAGTIRGLWFNGILQPEIDIDNPAYTPDLVKQALLSVLLFQTDISSALFAGVGGDCMPRCLSHYFPQSTGTIVELSPTIVALAKQYFSYDLLQERWRLVEGDIRDTTCAIDEQYDHMVIDISDGHATPMGLLQKGFLYRCRDRLTDAGTIAINLLVDDAEGFMSAYQNLREVFDRKTLCVQVPDFKNIVLLAFQQVPSLPSRERVKGLTESGV